MAATHSELLREALEVKVRLDRSTRREHVLPQLLALACIGEVELQLNSETALERGIDVAVMVAREDADARECFESLQQVVRLEVRVAVVARLTASFEVSCSTSSAALPV